MKTYVLMVAGLAVAFGPVAAQVRVQEAVAVAGRVLDAGTGLPVPGAVVVLEPLPGGLVIDARSGAVVTPTRTLVTGAGGEYRFDELPPGRYRLHVQRIGYRPATLEAEVHRPVDARLSIALELEPIALRPVLVEDRAASPFQRAANAPFELDEARVGLERQRQTTFLTPDARVLTYADVMDGVTLGEADVFRALQRFAGVATRDDYTAELWTRGAPWSQTRVTFDGMPLFNPVHAVGVLSAITPEILGVVFFHPGVRPVSAAEGAAGVVDMRSRPGGGDGELKGVADVSMASAKLALEQQLGDGRASWIVAGRRSYFDLLRRGLGWLSLGDLDLPYAFHDLTGRLDVAVGKGSALEVSALWEEDRLFGDVEGVLERTRAHWGNAAGRVTLHTSLGGLRTSHTAALSRYAARVQE
ncbi:MAG: carboxypeptidase-like regulatory domain-containing protein, partial [Gemmatimonadetes bacterium]|nr:carboxypeptidase-like regulatory domain-containing protein [Gemmatimonadota bacterium]